MKIYYIRENKQDTDDSQTNLWVLLLCIADTERELLCIGSGTDETEAVRGPDESRVAAVLQGECE